MFIENEKNKSQQITNLKRLTIPQASHDP